jgi:hypothetical protein
MVCSPDSAGLEVMDGMPKVRTPEVTIGLAKF